MVKMIDLKCESCGEIVQIYNPEYPEEIKHCPCCGKKDIKKDEWRKLN